MMIRTRRLLTVLILCLAVVPPADAATVAREEMRDGERYLVLENDAARVAVWPDAGGTITEFVDKRTGHDYVTKGVRKGVVGHGWKETTTVGDWETAPPELSIGTRPYAGELLQGKGYAAIVVTCSLEHLTVRREMRLADNGTALTVLISHTNRSDAPKMIWLRFHPFMTFDDNANASGVILMPGPGVNAIRTVRRIPREPGFTDANFMDVSGYWMVANPATGAGMWMTFDPRDVMVNAVWTAKLSSTAEIYPHPRVVAPGDALQLQCVYQPFVAADGDDTLVRTFIPVDAQPAAASFLRRVRPNLDVVGTHSMTALPGWPTPTPSAKNPGTAAQQNLFHFMHRRRDRFALRDWGIADAMMSVPGAQTIPLRLKFHAQAFKGTATPVAITFDLRITDALDAVVKQQQWQRTLTPGSQMVIDEPQLISLADLPDGRYTFALHVREGDGTTIHSFIERHKLAGHAFAAAAEARIKAELNVPLEQRERAFVKALRQVELPDVQLGDMALPIGVEEASGVARQAWPVRVGVPFAQSVLARDHTVSLSSPEGAAVAAQTHVMGTWLDGSVKWLLVDFQADVPANGHVFYTLRLADAAKSSLPDLATVDGQTIHVDTGAGKWTFKPDDAALLGLFERDGLWWRTADGREFRLELRGEGAGLRVLENGPMRAVVQAVGWYYPVDGPSDARPVARGDLRAEFYKGKAWHRLDHTFTFTGDPWHDAIAGTGARFSNMLPQAQVAEVDRDGKTVRREAPLTLWQPDEDHAMIETPGTPGTAGHTTDAGRRSTGAAALVRDQQRAVVYHRHLWEMFPKLMTADPAQGRIAFEYWPTRAGVLDWRPNEDDWHSSSPAPQQLAVGVSRTHQFVVDRIGAWQPHEYQAIFDESVIAVVPPRYLCDTRALMHLQPYDPAIAPAMENHLSEAIDSYRLHREVFGWYGQWDFGTVHNVYEANLQRWGTYGRYANIMNEQNIAHLPWLAYLRSGDRRHLRFAELHTRHLMDVGSIRWNDVHPHGVGMSRRHHKCVWLSPADYGHSMLDPFVEMYHATGNRQGWEAAERMAVAMSRQKSGGWRYLSNPVTGLTRMYLETQLQFYKEHADRLWNDLCMPDRNEWFNGDHGSRMAMSYSQINDDCKRLWREMTDTKKAFHTLDALAAQYEQTGDAKYAQWSAEQFQARVDRIQSYDPERKNPMLWSTAMHTQHVLAALREMVYASKALEAAPAKQAEK